jgi:CTP synthase
MKYIFVSGGVVSGLGKGITAASIGLLLKSKSISVTNIKIDMYLNLDAGTIRPQEHGEVFVTADGLETDQDLGNYERFLGVSLKRVNYMTTGQVYNSVIDRERSFGYEGEDVEAIPDITNEILDRIDQAGRENSSQVVIIELGGTVGEYQNILFFEANRILKLRHPEDVIHIHVTYLPVIKSIGELKSKPAQQSTHLLIGLGIQPDFIIARSEKEIDDKRREKLALFCNVQKEAIIGNPDLESIYDVPLFFEKQKLAQLIIRKLKIKKTPKTTLLNQWKKFTRLQSKSKLETKIAIVGKYFGTGDYKLADSYISVIEALRQSAIHEQCRLSLSWIDSEDVAKGKVDLKKFNGIIVPQGWGSRGIEGKLKSIQFARENNVPFLGLCFGMQMAVIEYARHVLNLVDANTAEADPKSPHQVIHIMPDQAEFLAKHQYGGTIRLGSYPCLLSPKSLLAKLYQKYGSPKNSPWYTDAKIVGQKISQGIVFERHRHRYEFNHLYQKRFEKAGLLISGTSPDGSLVEAIEIPDHPFFIGTQFHPEYISRPLTPHPLFRGFIAACNNMR